MYDFVLLACAKNTLRSRLVDAALFGSVGIVSIESLVNSHFMQLMSNDRRLSRMIPRKLVDVKENHNERVTGVVFAYQFHRIQTNPQAV